MKLSFRIWMLIIVIVLSVVAIAPSFKSGVIISSIERNSTLAKTGITAGEQLLSLNGREIKSLEDYALALHTISPNGSEQRINIVTNKDQYIFFTNESLPLFVAEKPKTKIKTGLDLRGGARALVQPQGDINDEQLDSLVEITRNRLNVYGLSDVNIRGVTDFSGNKFMLIEIAGATPADLEQLIAQQGKFEAKIGNTTVFVGGQDKDIRDVCRNDAKCSAVTSCSPAREGYACNFQFTVYLSEEAAQRHADFTSNLSLDETGQYLSEKLYLFVDNTEVDSLLISKNLRGQKTTQISIQGSGTGANQEEALKNAKADMRKLQTVLLTGSLPYKLEIVRLDTVSPKLGESFTRAILLAGFCSILAVSLIIFVRYRKFKASVFLLITSFSEIIIILGVAAFIGWNLDLPSIAGILATIGTGVDQQIVILDEAKRSLEVSIKERMKRALFVIMSAYFTAAVSLLPLYKAGAGLFKGFALTTLVGITAGVLISRPAFADMIKKTEA